jgi:hypothetical protein
VGRRGAADAAPLAGPLHATLSAQAEARTAIVNPFGAVVPQNKRTMAFMWEHIHRFSVRAQDVIRELSPLTMRLEALHPEMLLRPRREDWVLKSDYGAEGDEVVIGRARDEATWNESLAHARRGRWVAQRFFEAEKDERGRTTNFGVFVIAGEPAGLYARRRRAGYGRAALSVPVLLDPRAERRAGVLHSGPRWRDSSSSRTNAGRRRRRCGSSSGRTGREGRRGSPCR